MPEPRVSARAVLTGPKSGGVIVQIAWMSVTLDAAEADLFALQIMQASAGIAGHTPLLTYCQRGMALDTDPLPVQQS